MLTPNEQKVEALRAAVPALAERDQGFAKSLIESYDDRCQLTDKQFIWIEKLLDSTTPKAVAQVEADKEVLKPIVDLLVAAGKEMKKPAIRFAFPDGTRGKLSLAPSSGVNAGHIYVKDGSSYAGKITPAGELRLIGPNDDRKTALVEALTKFAEHPVETARQYGKDTKSCCFCGIGLTDPRSKIVGYGPICAAKFSLPWGEHEVSATEIAEEPTLTHDDAIEWPNGAGFTPCTHEYADLMGQRDALKPEGVNLDDLSPDDYNEWCALDSSVMIMEPPMRLSATEATILLHVKRVREDEANIGVLSIGERISVAMVLDRKDLLPGSSPTFLEAVARLGPELTTASLNVQRAITGY